MTNDVRLVFETSAVFSYITRPSAGSASKTRTSRYLVDASNGDVFNSFTPLRFFFCYAMSSDSCPAVSETKISPGPGHGGGYIRPTVDFIACYAPYDPAGAENITSVLRDCARGGEPQVVRDYTYSLTATSPCYVYVNATPPTNPDTASSFSGVVDCVPDDPRNVNNTYQIKCLPRDTAAHAKAHGAGVGTAATPPLVTLGAWVLAVSAVHLQWTGELVN